MRSRYCSDGPCDWERNHGSTRRTAIMHHKISRKRSEQGWSEHDTDRHRKMTAEYRSLCKRLRDQLRRVAFRPTRPTGGPALP